jgi:hypothetical protein
VKQLLRLLVFGVVGLAVVLGLGSFLLNRNAPRRLPTSVPIAAALTASGPPAVLAPTAIPKGYVSRETMGKDWPLTVDYGDLACEGNKLVTFRSPMGDTYAVNAPARTQMKTKGWRDILTIDKTGADLFALIDIGLKMCP